MSTKSYLIGIILIIAIGSIFAMSFNQEVILTVVPGIITIYSPANEIVYDSRMVLINISLDEPADLSYSDNGRGFITICRDCTEFSNLKPFDDGFHIVIFKAIFANGIVYQNISFIVDSQGPRIRKVLPNNKHAFGDFFIELEEENPINLVLYYENKNKEFDINSACTKSSEKDYLCDVFVNLSEFSGQEIDYYFGVMDIAGNIENSRINTIKVDVEKPNLIVYEPKDQSTYGKRVQFNLTSSEKSSIEYYDDNPYSFFRGLFGIDVKPRWKTLCDNCVEYGFTETETERMNQGEHNLIFKATDVAGNTDQVIVEIDVDY